MERSVALGACVTDADVAGVKRRGALDTHPFPVAGRRGLRCRAGAPRCGVVLLAGEHRALAGRQLVADDQLAVAAELDDDAIGERQFRRMQRRSERHETERGNSQPRQPWAADATGRPYQFRCRIAAGE